MLYGVNYYKVNSEEKKVNNLFVFRKIGEDYLGNSIKIGTEESDNLTIIFEDIEEAENIKKAIDTLLEKERKMNKNA